MTEYQKPALKIGSQFQTKNSGLLTVTRILGNQVEFSDGKQRHFKNVELMLIHQHEHKLSIDDNLSSLEH